MDSPQLRLVDSVTELRSSDRGCFGVTGSHGGMSAARYAVAVRPLLTVFNDAGVGKNRAGIAGLALLESAGLAGCAVSHASACIGQARSTWLDGIVSHCNAPAVALGIRPGLSVQACATLLGAKPPPDDEALQTPQTTSAFSR